MCRTVIFTFDTPEGGQSARRVLYELDRQGKLELDEALALTRGAGGVVRRRPDATSQIMTGALVGGLVGLPLTFMFPVASVLFGICVGGLIGWLLTTRRIEEEFLIEAEAALQPGCSALLILIRTRDAAAVGEALRGRGAHLLQSTLAPEHEALLRQAIANSPDLLPPPAETAGLSAAQPA